MTLVQQPIKTTYGLQWNVKVVDSVVLSVGPRDNADYTRREDYYRKITLPALLGVAQVLPCQPHILHIFSSLQNLWLTAAVIASPRRFRDFITEE